MNFQKYANESKQNFLNDLDKLLRIDTVLVEQPEIKEAPFGENLVKALNYMLDLGKEKLVLFSITSLPIDESRYAVSIFSTNLFCSSVGCFKLEILPIYILDIRFSISLM